MSFLSKIPWWIRKCGTVRCRDATTNSFVAKFRGEFFSHFHAVSVKGHSIVQNWLFGLPRRILCEQFPLISWKMMSMLFTLLFTCLAFFRFRVFWTLWVWLMLFFPNACLIIARVSVALCRDLRRSWCSSFVGFIAKSHQIRHTTPNIRS
jgi:hypothetical protein